MRFFFSLLYDLKNHDSNLLDVFLITSNYDFWESQNNFLFSGFVFREQFSEFRFERGKIEAVNDSSFISSGTLVAAADRQLRVSELPVGVWTQDYKEFLDSLIKNEAVKAEQTNLLRNYTEHHTGNLVPQMFRPRCEAFYVFFFFFFFFFLPAALSWFSV